jgi:hypothetical protein
MAVTATYSTVYDGIKSAVVQVNITADSVGDLNPEAAVDVSALTPPARGVKVKRASWTVSGGTVSLLWDTIAGDDTPAILMSGTGLMDYSAIGGMPNMSPSPQGDLLVKTIGFTAGSTATIELELRKKR